MNTPMPLRRRLFSIAILISFLFTSHAFSGVVYEVETRDFTSGSEPQVTVSSIMADSGNLKMTMAGEKGDASGEMIFNGSKRELLMIDHERRSYTALNEGQMAALAMQMEQAMSQYQKMLESVPPAQREMMEKMMKGRMPQGMPAANAGPKIEIQDTGKTEKIGKYPTRIYELTSDGATQQEHWIASWSNLEGGDDIADAFKGMAGLFKQFMETMSQGPMGAMIAQRMASSAWMTQMESVGGMPVQTKMYRADGSVERETRILGAEQTSIAASEFAPPKKYKRQKMDMGR